MRAAILGEVPEADPRLNPRVKFSGKGRISTFHLAKLFVQDNCLLFIWEESLPPPTDPPPGVAGWGGGKARGRSPGAGSRLGERADP